MMDRYDVVETAEGSWMVLYDGYQLGEPMDYQLGCGTRTFATRALAQAFRDEHEASKRTNCKDNVKD